MKYLVINKLLWFILVLFSMVYDLSFVFISAFINFLWNFKFRFKYYWNECHKDSDIIHNSKTGELELVILPPKSVKETFIYRLNYWKDENNI